MIAMLRRSLGVDTVAGSEIGRQSSNAGERQKTANYSVKYSSFGGKNSQNPKLRLQYRFGRPFRSPPNQSVGRSRPSGRETAAHGPPVPRSLDRKSPRGRGRDQEF